MFFIIPFSILFAARLSFPHDDIFIAILVNINTWSRIMCLHLFLLFLYSFVILPQASSPPCPAVLILGNSGCWKMSRVIESDKGVQYNTMAAQAQGATAQPPPPTSAVLTAAHKEITKRCGTLANEFMRCKTDGTGDPAQCVAQGKKLAGCTLSLYVTYMTLLRLWRHLFTVFNVRFHPPLKNKISYAPLIYPLNFLCGYEMENGKVERLKCINEVRQRVCGICQVHGLQWVSCLGWEIEISSTSYTMVFPFLRASFSWQCFDRFEESILVLVKYMILNTNYDDICCGREQKRIQDVQKRANGFWGESRRSLEISVETFFFFWKSLKGISWIR